MDLTIEVEEAQITTTRNSNRVKVLLIGIDKQDLISSDVMQEIGIPDFVGEFGGQQVLDFLKDQYGELFDNQE